MSLTFPGMKPLPEEMRLLADAFARRGMLVQADKLRVTASKFDAVVEKAQSEDYRVSATCEEVLTVGLEAAGVFIASRRDLGIETSFAA